MTGAGTSGYAGINGTVNAQNSILRYDVSDDASQTLSARNGFTTLGYQLSNNATLSLTGTGTFGQSVVLAGTGAVDNTADIVTINGSALLSTSVIQPGSTNSSQPPTALTITNGATLAMTRSSTNFYPVATVFLGTADSLTNTGTITLTDTTGSSTGLQAALAGGSSITNTGSITATGGYAINASMTYGYPMAITNAGTIGSNLTAIALSNSTSITNSGTIASTSGAAIADVNGYAVTDTIVNLASGTITGVGTAIQMPGGTLSNAGTINGNVNLGYSYNGQLYGYPSENTATYIANGGTINGNLTFGGGTNLLVETGTGYGVTGTIDGGGGIDWVEHLRTGTGTVTLGTGLPIGFTHEAVVASGTAAQVTLTGPTGYTGNLYVGGAGTIINQLATAGSVADLSALPATTADTNVYLTRFSNRANIGSVSLGTAALDNSATIGSASLNGAAVSQASASTLTFANSGTVVNNALSAAVSLYGYAGSGSITNSGTVTGGISVATSGSGVVSIVNSGTITAFTQNTYGPTPQPPYYGVLSSTNYALVGSTFGATSFTLANSGAITGDIVLNGSDVTLVNTGTITGNITTGTGNDTIAMNGVFSGRVDGGAGTNTLSINGGSQSAPVAFSGIDNIAVLTQARGFATVSGMANLGRAVLTGGRLVGLGGSMIDASTITVGSGATFGSAGTVNANLAISGTLSPGASPGTMTVNGNVALASGSTSLFEIAPAAQDKLNVNGKVTIASGSTLQIAATTPIKAGTTLNLISATGGITGSFDTVTGIAGVLKPQANGGLGLLVQFANASSFNPQVQRSIAYVNNAMAAASAPAALFPALSALQDGNGAPIASAFARLTPEPYADAMQIGTETALSLAGNARMLGEGETTGPAHLFGFGQALGSLRQFASREDQGVSHATINGYGGLGGLGVAGEGYAVSAYVGWVDQSQTVASLGASTHARGAVGGVAARFGGQATHITLSAAYDAAHALTRRDVPDAGFVSSAYSLPSWSFDASLSQSVPLGQGWLLRPQVGTTWVMTRHDAIAEASAHPFALSVAAADVTQGFVDAGLNFETAPDAKGPWRRFLTLGARYRVQGGLPDATAALAGYSSSLEALGVSRNRVDVTLAAGVEYLLAPGTSLFLNGSGELGKASKRESVTGGVHFRF